MNLLTLRDRIRTKAIEVGLTYSEIEQLADVNELRNQTMPCLMWNYSGENNNFEQSINEMTIDIYLMTNFFDSVKVESAEYQRDFIVTEKNILRDLYIDWLKEMPFESDTDFLEVIRDNQVPIAERLSIEGFLVIEFRVTIRSLRGFCLDSESVPTENVSIYFNDVKKYEVDEDIYLELVNQDDEEITATFEGNKIIVNQESLECENVNIQVNGIEFLELESGQEFDILVEYENGTPVGSLSEGMIIIPNPTECDPSEIEINSNPFATLPSGDPLNIDVVSSGDNPVGTITSGQVVVANSDVFANGVQIGDVESEQDFNFDVTLNGVNSGTWNAGTQKWEVVALDTGAMPTQTGQTTVVFTNSDGQTQRGRLVDFFTLSYNNVFGNTNRFTDILGGQNFSTNGNIVIDHSSKASQSNKILGYCFSTHSNQTGTQNQENWCLNEPYTCNGFSNFKVANKNEVDLIMNIESTNGINLAPFSIAATSGNRFYTSTGFSTTGNLNQAVYGPYTVPILTYVSRTNLFRAMLVREFTWNGSSLT